MGDSQQPKKTAHTFEVPDLELGPVRRASSRDLPAQAENRRVEYGGLNLFDEEAFTAGSPTFELGSANEQPAPNLSQSLELDFDARGGLELQDNRIASDARERESDAQRAQMPDARAATPSATASKVEPTPLTSDEIRLFANHGEAPTSAYLAPAYAYRVFRRKRELRHALGSLQSERKRAKLERERTERTNGDEAATQRATEHELALDRRSELYARALDAYDQRRVAQGVRLACTVAAIVIFLILLKFAL